MSFLIDCWTRTPLDDSHRTTLLDLLKNLLMAGEIQHKDTLVDVLFGTSNDLVAVLKCFNRILEQENLDVSQLLEEISPLVILSRHPAVTQLLADNKVHRQVIRILRRQSKFSGEEADTLRLCLGVILW